MKEIKRNSNITKTISSNNITVKGVATVSKVAHKKGRQNRKYINVCVQDIIFTFNNKKYYINHCWLQQNDYPKQWRYQIVEGESYSIEFTFYPYHDAIDRNMYGMNICKVS